MPSHIIHSYVRGLWGIETPDDPYTRVATLSEPSVELLDRALAGWERFTGSQERQADA